LGQGLTRLRRVRARRQVTGRIIKIDFDAQPDLHPDHDDHHAEAKLTHAMIRQ
jgi:hypothetical protein